MSPKITSNHACGDSLLKCADCHAQICPKCVVECPVGNRCGACGKGSGKVQLHAKPIDAKKATGFLLFGGVYGWMISYATLSALSICFCIAMWVAGRETGSQLRRGDKDLAISWMLPFVTGMVLGTVVLFFYSGSMESLILLVINVGVMLIGLLMGGCGFG